MALDEVAGGFFDQGQLLRGDRFEVDWAGGAGQAGKAIVADPSAIGEKFQRKQERVAGEGGERSVGRVAVAGGAERQHLPDALFGGGEKIGESVGGGSEIADAARRRQRSDVQQEARGALKRHG